MPMPADQPKTSKLTIYMIKPEFAELDDIVSSDQDPIVIPGIGTFVFKNSHSHKPDWVTTFFGASLRNDIRLFSSTARGVLIVPMVRSGVTTHFAVSFGAGRFLLKDGVVEERFGLKVVLNSVDPLSFRSIEKTTLGSVPKQIHEQMSKAVAPSAFGIDIEQDLVSSVTGKSQDERVGNTITGKDALSTAVKVDVTNIVSFLSHCLDRYRSVDYKANYDWIDQIAEVRDRRLEGRLWEDAVARFNRGELSKLWMAVPETVNWSDVKGFRYIRERRGDLYADLDIPTFLSNLGHNPVTIEDLKSTRVFLISAETDLTIVRWPVFRCLYAESAIDQKNFVLNNGKWYEIAGDFVEDVNRDFAGIRQSTIELPTCESPNESDYNVAAADAISGSCCMDSKLIVHGGRHSRIEFCDIFTSDRKIIHVKKYGQSSVLNHLFSQGVVSGELFVSDAEFRRKLNDELPATHRLRDASTRPNPGDYEIVFAIISNSDFDLNLPFFSKVSLRNARRRLAGFGYHVALNKVQQVLPPSTAQQVEANTT